MWFMVLENLFFSLLEYIKPGFFWGHVWHHLLFATFDYAALAPKQQQINCIRSKISASFNISSRTCVLINGHQLSHYTENERHQMAFSSVLFALYSIVILRTNSLSAYTCDSFFHCAIVVVVVEPFPVIHYFSVSLGLTVVVNVDKIILNYRWCIQGLFLTRRWGKMC